MSKPFTGEKTQMAISIKKKDSQTLKHSRGHK